MVKEFFIPTSGNHYYPIGLRPRFLYTYVVFMLIFNLFASRFLVYFPSPVHAQSTYTSNDIITLTNQDRIANGLAALHTNSQLTAAAQAKAADMFKYQYWAHYNPTTGASPWDFIVQAGYNYHYAGENLAEGYDSADAVNTAWMNSAEHRDNILNSNYQDIGVAVSYGSLLGSNIILVVQMFGALQQVVNITPYPTPAFTPTPAPHVQGITITPKPTITPKAVLNSQPSMTPTPSPVPTQTITMTPTPLISPTITQKTEPQHTNTTVHASPVTQMVENIQTQVLGLKFTTGINLLVALFLILLFSIDAICYYKIRNIQARVKPTSIAHIPLLTILAIICLMGTLGVTL